MEVTNTDVFTTPEYMRMLSSMRLPVKVSLQVAKLARKLGDSYTIVEEVRNGLVTKYGQEQKSGEFAVIFPTDVLKRPVSPEHEKFTSELNELMAQPVVIDAEKVQLPSMVDGKPLQIEPSILIALEKFIDVV